MTAKQRKHLAKHFAMLASALKGSGFTIDTVALFDWTMAHLDGPFTDEEMRELRLHLTRVAERARIRRLRKWVRRLPAPEATR